MAVQRTVIILFLLCIKFYISDQSNSEVQQPADILGDDSPENKRHNEIDLVKNLSIIIL